MSIIPNRTEVLLVSMPWAPAHEPSLGLAILKACLTRGGVSARVIHTAPFLLGWITRETYQFLADCWAINEFLFTKELDSSFDSAQQERLHERIEHYAAIGLHKRYNTVESLWELVTRIRDEVIPVFLNECVEQILACSPRLVGFTCLFDQTMASLAVAKRLKALDPTIPIVFGGYALQGPPGETIACAFPWIDAIVIGDGEQVIVDIARHGIPHNNRSEHGTRKPAFISAPLTDLNTSPTPDYSDWFDSLRDLSARYAVDVQERVLPVEASRGCWWGQSMHCIFCGIDDETLKYRHKSSEITLDMLHQMRDRYGDHVFRFSDYIMPKAYYTKLLPILAQEQPKFRLQGELKANHPPDRVKLLADAGFLEVQPGIESFATPVLQAMNKGVRGIDNISLLKAGYVNRLIIDYNILYGLPSDTEEMYLPIIEQLPSLYHLIPPISRNETVVTRFAPLQADPARFGIATSAVHHLSYDVLLSQKFLAESGFSLDSYAYYFDRNFSYAPELELVYSQMCIQIDHWKNQHRIRFVELSYIVRNDHVEVVDSRFGGEESYALSRVASQMYLACDQRPTPLDKLRLICDGNDLMPEDTFEQALSELKARRLVWIEGSYALGLAIDRAVTDAHKQTGWCKAWWSLYT